jgi:Ca2+-binding RTX toxin-like protein
MALFTGTGGNDTQNGTSNGDIFNYEQGGIDTLNGLGGSDIFALGAQFTSADKINGGSGTDTLRIAGNLIVNFASDTMRNIETLKVDNGFDYSLFLHDDNIGRNKTLVIDGSSLDASSVLIANCGGELDGSLDITGGAANDTLFGGQKADELTGGAGNDVLFGAKGADILKGGTGADEYGLARPGGSGANHDTFIGFDFQVDTIAVAFGVTGVDAQVNGGSLSGASFDADLAAAIGNNQMDAHHAVLFTPDAGDLAGHIFLVIDQNGNSGYQAGKDHVVELQNAQHLNDLGEEDFVPAM